MDNKRLKGISLNGVPLTAEMADDGQTDNEVRDFISGEVKQMKATIGRSGRTKNDFTTKKGMNGPVKIWSRREIEEEYGPMKKNDSGYGEILRVIESSGPIKISSIAEMLGRPYSRLQSRVGYLYRRLQSLGVDGLKREVNPTHGGHGHVYWIEGTTAQELFEVYQRNQRVKVRKGVSATKSDLAPIPSQTNPPTSDPCSTGQTDPQSDGLLTVAEAIKAVEDNPNWGIDSPEDTQRVDDSNKIQQLIDMLTTPIGEAVERSLRRRTVKPENGQGNLFCGNQTTDSDVKVKIDVAVNVKFSLK